MLLFKAAQNVRNYSPVFFFQMTSELQVFLWHRLAESEVQFKVRSLQSLIFPLINHQNLPLFDSANSNSNHFSTNGIHSKSQNFVHQFQNQNFFKKNLIHLSNKLFIILWKCVITDNVTVPRFLILFHLSNGIRTDKILEFGKFLNFFCKFCSYRIFEF